MDFQTINTTSLTKTPPNDNEAERALLGSLLLAPQRLPDIADISADDFYTPTHQLLYTAICTIIKTRAADELDLLVLRAEAEKAGFADIAYLAALVDAVPSGANITYYAGIVREKARKRRLINYCLTAAYDLYDDKPVHETLTTHLENLHALRTDAETPWTLFSDGKPVAIMQREYVRYLEEVGFRATIFNHSLQFTRVAEKHIVTEVEWFKNVCFTLKTALKDTYEEKHPLLWELLLKEHKFDYKIMTSLAIIKQEEFIADDANHCHLFFKNGCVTITKTDVQFRPYAELTGYVWEKAISPYEYHGRFTDAPAYAPDDEIRIDRKADFERFVYWIANEVVDGHWVGNKECFEQGIASLCWHYNDVLAQKAVVVIDNDPSYFSDGRRGKRILMDALRYIRSNGSPDGVVIKEDGKAFGGTFKFQRVKPNTKVLIIDDVDDESVNFKQFYSAVTDGLVSEAKGMTRFAFTPETSPKICFTTNRPFFGMDRSSTDRLLILPMTDFFTKEGQKPAQVFGHRLFYDWDAAEWARFHDYMIRIIQEAMNRDPLRLPEPDLSIFNANRIMLEMPDVLVAYLDSLENDIDYDRDEVQDALKEQGFTFKKHGEFKQMLDKYCRLRNRALYKNTKDGRYKRSGVEYLRFVATLI